jgi:uncharacterized membrane protein YphA (DoxX/SURF4 family)
VLALVALRAGIGWHFFQQGVEKYENPKFTSEPFLRQAKGPFAGFYRAMIPEFHGFDDAMDELLGDNQPEIKDVRAVLADKNNPLNAWVDRVKQDWGKYAAEADAKYEFKAKPKEEKPDPAKAAEAKPVEGKPADAKPAEGDAAKAEEKLKSVIVDEKEEAAYRLDDAFLKLDAAVGEFRAWLMDNPHEVAYWHKLQRSKSGNEVPFERPRLSEQQAKVYAQRSKLKAEVATIERELEADLYNVLSAERRVDHKPLASEVTTLAKFDKFLMYSLMAIGVCLMAGFLTRLAAFGGAFFLLSVVGTQPPWVMDALPAYEQAIEMLALLVIATTASGRWLGLDYFLSKLCSGCCGAKGNCDAPKA